MLKLILLSTVIILIAKTNFSLSFLVSQQETINYCPDSCMNCSLQCSKDGKRCPPGLFCSSRETCECYEEYPYFMTCNGTNARIQNLQCATFDAGRNITEIGACIFRNRGYKQSHHPAYYTLPSSELELNEIFCHNINRTGTLCGRCLPGHSPLAYSYNMTCVHCPHPHWNWLWYIMAAYLPLTLFYFFIVFFKVNTTSSHLFIVVYYCQTTSIPALLRNLMIRISIRANTSYVILGKIVFSIYGVWNLDFFRPFYSNLCLDVSVLSMLALDYAIAVYPLLLMVVSYLLITLYDKNYRVVTAMWSPFRRLFSLFKRNWDVKTCVIDSFATFFLLSNAKFLSVSFDLLAPVTVYRFQEGRYTTTRALYYIGNVQYFDNEHLPFAILAIFALSFFVLLPTAIIFLYPFKFFQLILNHFQIRSFLLQTLMDSCLGCYKDGTEPGTRDCRWFASTFMAVRFILFVLFFNDNYAVFITISVFTFAVQIMLLVIVQPFKASLTHYTHIYLIFLMSMVLQLVSNAGIVLASMIAHQYIHMFYGFFCFLGLAPIFYALGTIARWAYVHSRFRWRVLRQGYMRLQESQESVPDRFENPTHFPKRLTNYAATP